MRIRKRIVRAGLLAAALALLVWRYGWSLRAPAIGPLGRAGGAALQASGAIQAEEVRLSAEYGGRVAEVRAQEGERVAAGQVVVRLDPTLLDDRVAIAAVELEIARLALSRLQAGSRPGTIAVARAQAAQARAARDAARLALADAQALLAEPQELTLQAAVARQQLAAAEARVEQAAALRDLAQMGVEALEYLQGVRRDWHLPVPPPGIPLPLEEAPYDLWRAWSSLNAAVAARDGARERLARLEAELAAPQSFTAQADAAASSLAQAEAALQAAEAQVAALEAGPTAEQLAAAESRVAQATGALEALRLERSRLQVAAPLEATVLVRQVEPGEVVAPGAPLMTLASLREVRLVLYVPEPDLGRVHLLQTVRVSVDGHPGRVFTGQVQAIAARPEFTPRNVATEEERVNTFYAVQVRLPNPDGALKPGMPADATFGEGEGPAPAASAGEGTAWLRGVSLTGGQGEEAGPIRASGVIQARQVTVAAEVNGRVRAVHTAEGESVEAGAVLLTLDDAHWRANMGQAEAAVAAARAELAALQAGARAEALAVAEAQLGQAQAAYAGAQKALQHAMAARQAPQELEARVVAARTGLATAGQALEAARAELERAAFERDRQPYGSREWQAAEFRRRAAAAGVAAAQAEVAAAQAHLEGLEAVRRRPLALLAAEHQAQGGVQIAAAARKVAEARLDDLRAGPQAEEVALAQAKLRLAEAQARALAHQGERLTLRSPAAGVVLARMVQPGEAVLPGAPLLKIGDLERVELVLYVPEPRIGQVALGQAVEVTVDGYPGRAFAGQVSHIADRAEYTPRNVATRQERINTYYAVRVSLSNPDRALKPGMPADAVLEAGD